MYTSTATNKILPIFFGEYYEKKEVPVQTRINYYTHGSVMPGRSYINSLSYRYDYQGQEKDNETGFNNFDLRMYDARYARWFNVDPMGQHHSPYLAMSNNPISFVDPTGGWDWDDVNNSYEGPDAYLGGWDPSTYMEEPNYSIDDDGYGKNRDWMEEAYQASVRNQRAFRNAMRAAGYEKVGDEWGYYEERSTRPKFEASGVNYTTTEQFVAAAYNPNFNAFGRNGVGTVILDGQVMGGGQLGPEIASTGNGPGPLAKSNGQLVPANVPTEGRPGPLRNEYLQTNQAGMFGDNTEWIGPTLIGLGSETIGKRFSLGGLATRGTSIASTVLRKVLPYRSSGIKAFTTNILGRASSTAVLGGAIGRFVPIIGWGWTYLDVISSFPKPKPNDASYGIYQGLQSGDLCFLKGSLVDTKNGLVTIENIKIHDSIYSFDVERNKIEVSSVLNVIARNTNEIYELLTSNQKIHVTAEHPFYVIEKGWVKVKNLKAGDKLKTKNHVINGEEVKTLKLIPQTVTVYNIEVDRNHDYFVTNSYILVHNKYIQSKNTETKLSLNHNLEKMKEEKFKRLKDFIIKQTFVQDVEITSNTIIETEFGVTGDDAVDFLFAFSKEFNVDVSNFEIAKYFKGEGDKTLKNIFNFFKGNKLEQKSSVLTVGDLERAILAGKLDETVIGVNE